MNQSLVAIIVGIPTAIVILLVAARALLPAVDLPRRSVLARLEPDDPRSDWALHVAVATMVLAIGTVIGVSIAGEPHALLGAFVGIFAAGVAFVIARPPVRDEAHNPELDVRSFLVSAVAQAALGMALAAVLIEFSTGI